MGCQKIRRRASLKKVRECEERSDELRDRVNGTSLLLTPPPFSLVAGVDCVAVISEVTRRGLDGDIEGVFDEWGKEEKRADP